MDQPELEEGDGPISIIMTPTRELCMQIGKDIKKFSKSLNIRAVCVYGGTGLLNYFIRPIKTIILFHASPCFVEYLQRR